ncbi:hypothetical protein [Amycolatopsis sp. NPDC059657]|uniref:hypothetical protein n=1 Tax=Amycolatopsis sp. NPDC059657 TaxID=3346899 RepID=UPI00366D8FFB
MFASYVVPDRQFSEVAKLDSFGLINDVEIAQLDSGDWRISPGDTATAAELENRYETWHPEVHGRDHVVEEYFDYEPEL